MFLSGRPGRTSSTRKLAFWPAVAIAAATVAVFSSGTAVAKRPQARAEVSLSALPAEAQAVHRLVLSGGPFPYPKDGSLFANRERALPFEPRGFYREYTVSTPGAANRGARRLVCGGQAATRPEACFYTADHYASFRRITE